MRTIIEYGHYENKVKTIQEFWDHHGSYRWTYFNERVKQHIEFFLQKKLSGRNLDVGGGWYLSYPNSDVVDISPVCLDYNIAPSERKHVFDLDSIAEGKILPFAGQTFDSATFISSWQYLAHPEAVMKELERVLKHDAELYIINGEDAGISEAAVNQNRSKDIAKTFEEKGYDTLIEDIPNSSGSIGGQGCFRSVCVVLPHSESGKIVSRIKDKEKRLKKISSFNSRKFMSDFAEAERAIELEKLKQVEEYPITKYSRNLLSKIENFSKEYAHETKNMPIFFSNEFSQLGFDMALDKEPHITATVLYCADDEYDDDFQEKGREYEIRFSQHINYLGVQSLEGFRQSLNGIAKKQHCNNDFSRETFMNTLIEFLAAQKLNSYAQETAEEIESALEYSGVKFDETVKKKTAFGFHLETSQYKQRRKVDELIERKNIIMAEPELIAGYGKIELNRFAPYFKSFILGRNE